MRKRNDPKPIQGWGWLGDAAEEAAVEAVAPARPLKNASTAKAATRPNKRSGRADAPPKPGGDHRPTDDEYRRLAKEQYQSAGKIGIDPHARVSRSEDVTGGAWVQGWVFVRKAGLGDRDTTCASAAAGQ